MTELDSYIDQNLFPKVYIEFLGKIQAQTLLSFSLLFFFRFFRITFLVYLLPFLYSLFLLLLLYPLQLDLGDTCPINPFAYHFLIMKMDFRGVVTIQTSHSTFNVADIRQRELINAEVIVTLSSASSSTCSSEKISEKVSSVKHMTASRSSYVSSRRLIPRSTLIMVPNGLFFMWLWLSYIYI